MGVSLESCEGEDMFLWKSAQALEAPARIQIPSDAPPPQTPANKTQEYLKDSTTLMGYNLF